MKTKITILFLLLATFVARAAAPSFGDTTNGNLTGLVIGTPRPRPIENYPPITGSISLYTPAGYDQGFFLHRPTTNDFAGYFLTTDPEYRLSHLNFFGMAEDYSNGAWFWVPAFDGPLQIDVISVGKGNYTNAPGKVGIGTIPSALTQLTVQDVDHKSIQTIGIYSWTNGLHTTSQSTYADAFEIERLVDPGFSSFLFHQGSGIYDWRFGLDILGGYNLNFYNESGTNTSSASSPGAMVLSLRYGNGAIPPSIYTPFAFTAGSVTSTGTVSSAKEITTNVFIGNPLYSTNQSSALMIDSDLQHPFSINYQGTTYIHSALGGGVTGLGLLNGCYLALEQNTTTIDPQMRFTLSASQGIIHTYNSTSPSFKMALNLDSSGELYLNPDNGDAIRCTSEIDPYTAGLYQVGSPAAHWGGGFFDGLNGRGYYTYTNSFPAVPGPLVIDWRFTQQFIVTNATFTIAGFINPSNSVVNQVVLSVSNSSASTITINFPAGIRDFGTNATAAATVPSTKVLKATFSLDPFGTNLVSSPQIN